MPITARQISCSSVRQEQAGTAGGAHGWLSRSPSRRNLHGSRRRPANGRYTSALRLPCAACTTDATVTGMPGPMLLQREADSR